MCFSNIGILIFVDKQEDVEPIESKYSYLLKEIKKIGYSMESYILIQQTQSTLEETLIDILKAKDIVLILDGFNQKIFNTITNIFKEPVIHDEAISSNFMGNSKDITIPLATKLLLEDDNPVVYLHRLFIINTTSPMFFSNFLLKTFIRFRAKPKYTKLYNYMKNSDYEKMKNLLLKKNYNIVLDNDREKRTFFVTGHTIQELNVVNDYINGNFISQYSEVVFQEDFYTRLFSNSNLNIQVAINHIIECFDTYGPENVFISFNGGKDCTVLLHLMLAIVKQNYPQYKQPVFCMYVQSKCPFQEINEFIKNMKEFYNLEVLTIDSGIKEGLENILNTRPNLKACLMGTRRTDPFSKNLEHFKMTDNGWPKVMRVSPLLDWDYGEIWDYLLEYKVPYCCLYDNGYTSLGNVDNTDPNPELFYHDPIDDQDKYLPAYKLLDGSKERSGRR